MYSFNGSNSLDEFQLQLYQNELAEEDFYSFASLLDSVNKPDGKWEKILPVYSLAFREDNNTKVSGDSIIMPQTVLHELTKKKVDFPLIFQVSFGERKVYCRSVEFTAPEGICLMPLWLMENLQVTDGTSVTFTHTQLPTATYVKFRPINDNQYLQWSNKKAVLESTLKEFATLSVGTTINIDFNDNHYQFEVIELKPSNATTILNSDVEVDFTEEAKGYDGFTITEEEGSKNLHNNFEEEVKNEIIDISPPLQENGNITFKSKNETANEDSQKSQRRVRGENNNNNNLNKTKLFSGTGFSLGGNPSSESSTSASTLSPTQSRISDSNSNMNIINIPSKVLINENKKPLDEENYYICKNCEKEIPKSALSHEAYCMRNNYKCDICKVVVNKSMKEKHIEEYHSTVECELCKQTIERYKFEEHLNSCPIPCNRCTQLIDRNEIEEHLAKCPIPCELCSTLIAPVNMAEHLALCPKQKIKCEYCELSFFLSEIEEHLDLCGSRTEKCEACGKYILLRDLELHFTSNCTYPGEHGRMASWETKDLTKSLIFCEDCFTPFYEFEEYQLHITLQSEILHNILYNTSAITINDIFSVISHRSIVEPVLYEEIDSEYGVFKFLQKIISAFPNPTNNNQSNEAEEYLTKLTNFLESYSIDVKTIFSQSSQNLIHISVKEGKNDLIQYFRKLGVVDTAIDSDGNTPLHTAAFFGIDHCISILPQTNNVNHFGYTPLDLAVEQMHKNTIKTLLLNNCKFGSSHLEAHTLETILPIISESLALCSFNNFVVNSKEVTINLANLLQYYNSEKQIDQIRAEYVKAVNQIDDSREVFGRVSPFVISRFANNFGCVKVINSGLDKFQIICHPKESGLSIVENNQFINKREELQISILPGNSDKSKSVVLLIEMKGDYCSYFDFLLILPSNDDFDYFS